MPNELIKDNFNQVYSIYETYSAPAFVQMLNQLRLTESYLLPENLEAQETQIVPFQIAQMPSVLLLINWTCHQQILYAQRERVCGGIKYIGQNVREMLEKVQFFLQNVVYFIKPACRGKMLIVITKEP